MNDLIHISRKYKEAEKARLVQSTKISERKYTRVASVNEIVSD